MHPTDDEFLRQAELCRNAAMHAASEELKMGWLRLAAEWLSMIAPQVPAEDADDLPCANGIAAGSSAGIPASQTRPANQTRFANRF